MSNYREIVNYIADEAEKKLESNMLSRNVRVDNNQTYDVQLKLITDGQEATYKPATLTFSYDSETGYHMDIDDISWELDGEVEFRETAERYISAIKEQALYMTQKKMFGFITLKKELLIKKGNV
jgi:hypothetical protein